MKIRTLTTLTLLIAPNFLYATTGPLGSLVDLANTLAGGVVTSLGYLMFTLAVVAFFWGIVQFIWAARGGDAGKGVENGKQFMLWGIIALFVMFSVWGIVKFAQGVFNIQGQTSITIPNIQLLGSTPGSSAGTTGLNGNTGGRAAGVGCTDSSQCASGLTCVGDNATSKVCTGTGATGDNGSGAGGAAASIQTCINNGSSRATCVCEASGGAWSFTDNICSNSVSGGGGLSVNSSCSGSGRGPCASGLECIENKCQSPSGGANSTPANGSPCTTPFCTGANNTPPCNNILGHYNTSLGKCIPDGNVVQ